MLRPLVVLVALGLAACNPALSEGGDDTHLGPAGISIKGGRVEYAARTEPTGNPHGWLRTVAVLRASGSAPVRLEYSGCPVEVQYFRTTARTGSPAWAQFRVQNFGCILPLYVRTLAPGDTLQLGALSLPREVLGDSLPAGRYYVAAVLRPNGETVRVPAGEVELTR